MQLLLSDPWEEENPLISLALILPYWFLPLYKLCLSLLEPWVSFGSAAIKITGQWNIPLRAWVADFEIIFSSVPVFLRHCSIVLCWRDFIGFCRVETHEMMSRMTNSIHDGFKMRFALLCSTSSLNLLHWNVLQSCKLIKMYPHS